MDRAELERIGDQLRHLGHERREVVEQIAADVNGGAEPEARELYRRLDNISEQCMDLMQRQRDLVRQELES